MELFVDILYSNQIKKANTFSFWDFVYANERSTPEWEIVILFFSEVIFNLFIIRKKAKFRTHYLVSLLQYFAYCQYTQDVPSSWLWW